MEWSVSRRWIDRPFPDGCVSLGTSGSSEQKSCLVQQRRVARDAVPEREDGHHRDDVRERLLVHLGQAVGPEELVVRLHPSRRDETRVRELVSENEPDVLEMNDDKPGVL